MGSDPRGLNIKTIHLYSYIKYRTVRFSNGLYFTTSAKYAHIHCKYIFYISFRRRGKKRFSAFPSESPNALERLGSQWR